VTKNVENIAEVIDALKAMGVEIDNPEFQRMLKAQALPIINSAKNLAPKEGGDLAASIGFITGKDKDNKTKVLIGLRKEYQNNYLGPMFEFGVPTNRIQSTTGRDTGILEARPFMRPALDQNAGKVTDGIINGVDKILAKLAKKNNLIYK
jgi:HK97 gp10 family phage protein